MLINCVKLPKAVEPKGLEQLQRELAIHRAQLLIGRTKVWQKFSSQDIDVATLKQINKAEKENGDADKFVRKAYLK